MQARAQKQDHVCNRSFETCPTKEKTTKSRIEKNIEHQI